MAYTDFDTDVRNNPASLEYGKFIKISDTDTRFPYVSTTRVAYAETGVEPTSSVDVYPHTAVLTYIVNAGDIAGGTGGGGGTTVVTPLTTNNWNIIEYNVGTSFGAFPSNAAKKISIVNDSGDVFTGQSVALRRTGSLTSFVLSPGMALDLELVANTNEISLSASAACTIHAVWSNQG
jgi:hypothetical protein